MNKYQKNYLITAAIAFVVCAVRIFTGPGSLAERSGWTLVYWAGMGLLFSLCFGRLKTPAKKD